MIQKATWDAETPFVAAKTDRIRGMILNHRIPSFPLLFLLNFSLFLNFFFFSMNSEPNPKSEC